MDQLPPAVLAALIAALFGLGGWLIPSPWKLAEANSTRLKQMDERHNHLLEKQNALERAQIESNTRLTAEVRGLAVAVRELKTTIKELTPAIRGQQRHEQRD